MKKIGVLTFNRAANYGAVLQAYALQKKLKDLGADCEVIDYVCEKIERNYNPSRRYSEKLYVRIYKWIYGVKTAEKRYHVFQSFLKNHVTLSQKEYNQNSIIETETLYDAIVVGSDQVWNREITGNDDSFFLEYVNDDKKKYSYAASAGDIKVDSEETKIIKEKTKDFSGISIREENMLTALDIRGAQAHIDPAFLLKKEDWNKIVEKPTRKNYVLVYSVRENWQLLKDAQRYAKNNNLELVYIYSHFNLKEAVKTLKERCHSIIREEILSPEQFVGLIRDADCVFTNSFHGAAFSIIFHKYFMANVSSSAGKINKRLEELLTKFELETCCLWDKDNLSDRQDVNWDRVEEIIKRERIFAETYLKNIIAES